MIRWLVIAFTLASSLSCGAAYGVERIAIVDGNTLKEWCETEVNDNSKSIDFLTHGKCTGYVLGAFDAIQGFSAMNNTCYIAPSKNVSLSQLIDVALSALNRYPELRHQPADALIMASWMKAFPCPK